MLWRDVALILNDRPPDDRRNITTTQTHVPEVESGPKGDFNRKDNVHKL